MIQKIFASAIRILIFVGFFLLVSFCYYKTIYHTAVHFIKSYAFFDYSGNSNIQSYYFQSQMFDNKNTFIIALDRSARVSRQRFDAERENNGLNKLKNYAGRRSIIDKFWIIRRTLWWIHSVD